MRRAYPPSASLRDSLPSPTLAPLTAQHTAQSELPTKEPKDPCKRIKRSEAPKFNGDMVKMPVEEFILEFMEYCALVGLTKDAHILTALNVSLTGKAIIWWRSKRDGIDGITTGTEAKEALMQAFRD